MTKHTLSIKGLHCAGCASKVEKGLNKLEEFSEASVDLINEKLKLMTSIENENELIEKLNKLVDGIEKGVTINSYKKTTKKHVHSCNCSHNHVHENTHLLSDSNLNKDSHLHEENEIKNTIIELIVTFVIFFTAIFSNLDDNIKFILYFFSYILIGRHVLLSAWENIKRKSIFDENFLMAIATIGAFVIGEYPEGVAVMIFYQVGELFQNLALQRSKKSISSLMNIKPEYANLEVNGQLKKVSPEEVKIDDVIIVKVGEKVPLDGVVVEGNSFFDTSNLTGESKPREISIDGKVLSGFINKTGLVKVRVTTVYENSTVSKILDLVENASSKKAKTEKFITKFAQYYTPVIVVIALVVAFVTPIVLQEEFTKWIYRALIFLVISCPCALVISIPLGFFGGIGGASRQGILVKGANYLEALNKVDTVIFDKTGTLTKGNFSVNKINIVDEFKDKYSTEEFLKIAAYSEYFSTHPIAESIKKMYLEENKGEIDESKISNYKEIAGKGISVVVDGNNMLAGNIKLMNENDVNIDVVKDVHYDETLVFIAENSKLLGYLIVNDELKSDSEETIKQLKKLNIKVKMLTGDNEKTAKKVADELGIDDYEANLLPTDKYSKVDEIIINKSNKDKKVMFVGDGINDAPVIMRSDVGVAMGGLGSDAAIEASDIVLMSDEPSKIYDAIQIAKKTRSIVYQNIIFALGVKAIFLILGLGGHATMWEAVFGDVGVAILAILNSSRAITYKRSIF